MRTWIKKPTPVNCVAGALAGLTMWATSFTVACALTLMINGSQRFWSACYWTMVGLSSIIIVTNAPIFQRLAGRLVARLTR